MADGSWFGGAHGPEGAWKTLKGPMLQPHIQAPLESGNTGDARFNGIVTNGVQSWDKFIKPSEGVTGPGGTLAKK